jgi:hypothetical protein
MDSSLIDPGTPPGAVATSFAKQELINASVMERSAFANIAPLRLCEKPDRSDNMDQFLAKAQRRNIRKDSSQGCAVSVRWPKL